MPAEASTHGGDCLEAEEEGPPPPSVRALVLGTGVDQPEAAPPPAPAVALAAAVASSPTRAMAAVARILEHGSNSSDGGCGCRLCAVARAALRCDPWIGALPAEDLAAMACELRTAVYDGHRHHRDHAGASLLGKGDRKATTLPEAEAVAEAEAASPDSQQKKSVDSPPPLPARGVVDGAQAWVVATGGQPLLALLRLYSLARRRHVKAGVAEGEVAPGRGVTATATASGAAASTTPPCCMAAKQLLAAVADVCRTAPAAVRREVAAAEGRPEGEQLAKGLVAEVRQLLEACPRCLLPRLGRDGRVASYDSTGIVPADPCRPPPPGRGRAGAGKTIATKPPGIVKTSPPPTAAEGRQQPPPGHPRDDIDDTPLVVVAMRALTALCACSRRAARVAYTAGALDLLQEAGRRLTHGSALEAEAEALYVTLAAQCQTAADDMCTGSDVRGLAALMAASPSAPPLSTPSPTAAVTATPRNRENAAPAPTVGAVEVSLRLRAASRLCALADACDADDFALLCRGRGNHAAAAAAGGNPTAAAQPAAALVTALQWMGYAYPVASSAAGCVAIATDEAAGGKGAVGGPEAVRIAARLLLACLERARRTGWIRGASSKAAAAAKTNGGGGCGGGGGGGRCSLVVGLRCSVWEEMTAAALEQLEAAAREAERTGLATSQPAAPLGSNNAAASPPAATASSMPAGSKSSAPAAPVVGTASGGGADGKHDGSAGITAENGTEYDEDGLRTVWDSGPRPAVAAARAAWSAVPLRERVSWSQTSTDVYVNLRLPPGTRKGELGVTISAQRLTVRLGWCGRVVDGPLHRGVAPGDSVWALEGDCLQVLLSKAERDHYWRALFEGGEEKGLYEVLREAVEADEPVLPYDNMDESSRLLLEELLERQSMIADGSFDLERSFDDFRLVVGDNTL